MLVVLPKYAKQVPWKTGTKEIDDMLETRKYFEKLNPKWRDLTDMIRKHVDARLIVVNEEETTTYP